MSNNFLVGQKVVCVPIWSGKYNFRKIYSELQWPEPNGVYTIRKITTAPLASPNGPESVGMALEEIPDQSHPEFGTNILWDANEFKPVSFLNLDISIFRKMLQPSGVDA